MPDIFGNSQIPAWLVAATHEDSGGLGRSLGTLLAGGMNALQRDPNAPADASWEDSRKGFGRGLTEAKLNAADPLWKLKAAQLQTSQLQKMAQAEAQFALTKERASETQAWMQDAPKLSPWLSASPEQRETMPSPVAASKTGMGLIEKTRDKDAQLAVMKDANKLREQTSRIQVDNLKRAADWDSAVGAESPDTQAAILELPNQGWIVDGQGRKLGPTTGALTILNAARRKSGLLPFGVKQTEVKKEDKPLSTIGKLEADKANALKTGAPPEVVAAYDAAIKKANESSAALYAEKPEVMEVEGKKFLKFGKQIRDLSGASSKDKAEISLLVSKIRTINNALVKDPKDVDLIAQLDAAQKALNKHFTTQAAPAKTTQMTETDKKAAVPQPIPSSPTNDINFDDFQKWKQNQ